jgi:hypothetical protein
MRHGKTVFFSAARAEDREFVLDLLDSRLAERLSELPFNPI